MEDPSAVRDVLPVPNLKRFAPEPPQLYDLSKDPGEQKDLASDQPERTKRMLDELHTWFESVEADRLSINEEGCPGASIRWD